MKFTMECSRETIAFLDTKVKLRDGTLYTDLYCTRTDSHSYLLYRSAHPQHCKNSIPHSQFLWTRRICSDIIDFDKHSLESASYFHQWGYPSDLVEESYMKDRWMNINTLLDPPKALYNEKPTEDQTILVTTFHPYGQMVPDVVASNWDQLGKSHNTLFLHQTHVMKAYRRWQTLQDVLSQACISHKPKSTLRPVMNRPRDQTLTFPQTDKKSTKQVFITDFFKSQGVSNSLITNSCSVGVLT